MKAYISISLNKRHLLDRVLKTIKEVLTRFEIEPYVFIDQHTFSQAQEKEMMRLAFSYIEGCDLLIAETSDKAIGIGIEAGYAKAINKPVIYIRHHAAEHSTTLAGTSDHQVIYDDLTHLEQQLTALITQSYQELTNPLPTSSV
jgi:nucleoside 2-deoxyribosyltransferase